MSNTLVFLTSQPITPHLDGQHCAAGLERGIGWNFGLLNSIARMHGDMGSKRLLADSDRSVNRQDLSGHQLGKPFPEQQSGRCKSKRIEPA
jgi:hypothetical protein